MYQLQKGRNARKKVLRVVAKATATIMLVDGDTPAVGPEQRPGWVRKNVEGWSMGHP